MKILIISDLHIGNNDDFSTFSWKAGNFIRAIELLKAEESIDKIVLNGDVFELYKYSFDEIVESNPSLVEYLMSHPDIIYLKGNHDAICPLGEESTSMINSHGNRIYIEHGHTADFMNGTFLGRKIQTFGFNLLRWGSKARWILNIYQKLLLAGEAINKIPKKYDSIRYLTHALHLLKNNDVVILGHTHKIESHKTYYLNKKKLYINCGSCSLGRFQGVILNTETLDYETIKFKNYKELLKEYKKPVVRKLAMIA